MSVETCHDRGGVAWLGPLVDALATNERAVLAVVATTQGSTPRETGAAMVVSSRACVGSVGGGHLEYEATRIAREALARTDAPQTWVARFPLAARLGQCCGGVATLAFLLVDRRTATWIDAVRSCTRTGAAFALVSSIAATVKPDARIIVTADDARGSLGDSALDSAAITVARTRLAAGAQGTTLVRTAAAADAGLLVQIERADPFPVLVFGNGHVGSALVGILGVLPAQVHWIDSRACDFPASVPANVEIVVTDSPEDELRDAQPGTFVVVVTHSHALDLALMETALARDDWRYIGLIGSRSKRVQFEKRLAARGIDGAAFARVHCPIGSDAVVLRSKHPGAIAVAIAAEVLKAREATAHRRFVPEAVAT